MKKLKDIPVDTAMWICFIVRMVAMLSGLLMIFFMFFKFITIKETSDNWYYTNNYSAYSRWGMFNDNMKYVLIAMLAMILFFILVNFRHLFAKMLGCICGFVAVYFTVAVFLYIRTVLRLKGGTFTIYYEFGFYATLVCCIIFTITLIIHTFWDIIYLGIMKNNMI